MKIHSIHPSVNGQSMAKRQASRLLAVCGAAALCLTVATTVQAQSGTVQNGLFTHGDEAFRVVDTAAFRTAADVGSPELGSIQQVGYNTCGSCGTGCGGTCGGPQYSSCGSGGGSFGGECEYTLDPCGPCYPFWYGSLEAVYMKRDGDDDYSLSRFFRMSSFDYEWAGRITIGRVPDCVHGCELSYTGHYQWDRFGLANDFGGRLESFLAPTGGLTSANLSAFENATLQTQAFRAEYWSVEANRTCMGWNLVKLLYGIRYLEYDEDFAFFSQNATDNGLLLSDVQNQMLGLQVGTDLVYPISRHGFVDLRTRFGLFANRAENRFAVFNGGFAQVANGDDKTELAGLFEFGSGVRYQVGEILSVRAGVEIWYMGGVATAKDQFTPLIFPLAGSSTRAKDDVLFTGVTFGSELRF